MFREYRDADAVIDKVSFTEKTYYLTKMPGYDGYKAYEVSLKGQVIGTVENVRDASYRKAGRLITRTTYSKKWAYNPSDFSVRPTPGLYYTTRKDAVLAMLAALFRAKKLKR